MPGRKNRQFQHAASRTRKFSGKRSSGGGALLRDRRERGEIGADRQNVVAGQLREIGVGEGRIVARAVGRHADSAARGRNPRRSSRRCRYRGPASGWANRCAPNGVSIRFPPANGFAGSAVWQLAQSPATTSALPRAMVSADGSAASRRARMHCTKRGPTRIARIDAMSAVAASIRPVRRIIEASRRFARKPFARHKPKMALPISGHEIAIFAQRGLCGRDLWCAGRKNRHRLVLSRLGMTS